MKNKTASKLKKKRTNIPLPFLTRLKTHLNKQKIAYDAQDTSEKIAQAVILALFLVGIIALVPYLRPIIGLVCMWACYRYLLFKTRSKFY